MRESCMLSLTPKEVDQVGEYCVANTSQLPQSLLGHSVTTAKSTERNGEMAGSLAQCAYLMSTARTQRPKRILELGTFTGISALAFYEATRDFDTEILSLDVDKDFITIAQAGFERYQATDRIRIIEGDCVQTLSQLEGDFDLIYVDADQFQYEAYVRLILDRKLLSPRGVILVDDVLLRGVTVDPVMSPTLSDEDREWCKEGAVHMNKFNHFAATDSRIIGTLLPFFNGIMHIVWR
ncbi:hypothetical protein N7471_008700 [Penicillium samsonianum]|uniref:uncharacterized protein n=1 Tax=Penicillium samsonianum TaxID=1882272 RepID=UPI0025497687|nr:uncharacterized protein N7471_008700 [Penicillium samsonianum]KAJ6133485.1 hypothetical protein N7471_008700 [Penicillium samsonianum]